MTEIEIWQEVTARLRDLDDRIQALMDLADRAPPSQPHKLRAQTLMGELKDLLDEGYRTSKRIMHPNIAMFSSAVHKAACAISVKRNSVPSEAWSSELYEAQIDIRFAQRNLKNPSEV
jgi:hypothetical protein